MGGIVSHRVRAALTLGIFTFVTAFSWTIVRSSAAPAETLGGGAPAPQLITRTRTPTATATTTPTATATPNTSMSSIKGIYVVDGIHKQKTGGGQQALTIDASMASSSIVDGFTLSQVLNWSDIEPSDGNFQWQAMDRLIAEAAGAGKKVTIGVLPGWTTPSWVYAEGVRSFSFVWDQTVWGPGFCTVAKIPVPWDPVF